MGEGITERSPKAAIASQKKILPSEKPEAVQNQVS